MEIVNFKAEHWEYIRTTDMVDFKLRPWLLPEHGKAIEELGGALTVLDEGKAVAMGGVLPYWQGRGEAWLIFGKTNTQSFVSIFKMVKRFLDLCELRRIEMVIDYDFEAGHRWARLLGFKKEAECLDYYRPDGGAVSLYSLIKKEAC